MLENEDSYPSQEEIEEMLSEKGLDIPLDSLDLLDIAE